MVIKNNESIHINKSNLKLNIFLSYENALLVVSAEHVMSGQEIRASTHHSETWSSENRL